MKTEQADVRLFTKLAGQEIPTNIQVPDRKTCVLRSNLILEETLETIDAFGCLVDGCGVCPVREPDMVKIADGLADLAYVVLGAAVACGIDLKSVFDEVHRSNMSKFIDGHRRDDGKWMKGPSYTPANLKPILEAQGMSEPK